MTDDNGENDFPKPECMKGCRTAASRSSSLRKAGVAVAYYTQEHVQRLSQNSVSLAWYNLNASSLSDHGEKGLAMTTRYNL